MNNKKGFTLVELLAVIAILAILVIIALPNVINMYTKAQKEAFLTETKKVYSEAEKKYISSSISGNTNTIINSEDDSKLDMTGEKLKYCILLYNNGKVKDLKVSNGKWIANLDNSKTIEELTIDDLEEGNLDDYDCSNQSTTSKPLNCTFDGEMVQGAEYVNGQYTYRYMQEKDISSWKNITSDGWGVMLTNKYSTDAVTSKVCTAINNKKVISMSHMFSYSYATSIDLSSFNTTNVTNMKSMFEGCNTENLDLSSFNTSNVTDMSWMFARSYATILDLSGFDTSNVIDMSGMFSDSKATTMDLRSFDTSNVTDMSWMFTSSQVITLDLSGFNTSNVINMRSMFDRSNATAINVSHFDTSNVTNMNAMFNGSKLITIDLSSFDTRKVTDMGDMFRNLDAKTIDLSSFDTSNVTNMSLMFNFSSNLETIYASNKFNTNNVPSGTSMFKNTFKLVGGASTKYNSSKIDKTYARIDGGTSSPGYFTKK